MAHLARERLGTDPLHQECAQRLTDRLKDVLKGFESCCVIGGAGLAFIQSYLGDSASSKLRHVTYIDQSPALASAAAALVQRHADRHALDLTCTAAVADEEYLSLPDGSHDLVVACNSLHWVNDLPAAFRECRRVLRPDGLFLASLLGGDSLFELRSACQLAEEERRGGIAPRTSPLVHVRDAGSLLTGAGFTLQTVDAEDMALQYDSVADPITHLREMAEQGAPGQGSEPVSRDSAIAAGALHMCGNGSGGHEVESTFDVMFLAGWSPHSSQGRPAPRGSGTASFKDIEQAARQMAQTA